MLLLLSHSGVSDSFVTPWTVALQAPLWDSPGKNTGVDCHVLFHGDLPDPGIELMSPTSPALAGTLYRKHHLGSLILR